MTPPSESGGSLPDRRPGADPAPFIPSAGEETPVPPESFRLFGSKPFLRLWIAQVFSSLGDWVGFVAILGITKTLTTGNASYAIAISLVMVARMLPGFFLATVGGVIVDRFDRRKVMVLCDLGRAALICTLPFVASLWQLVVVSFFIEIMTLLWGPAKDASVPHFVPEENLASANTLSLVASYGTLPLGAAIAAALAVVATWLGGFDALKSLKVDRDVVALWFDALTYVTSALIVVRLPIPKPTRHASQKIDFASSVREIKEGVAYMRSAPFSRAVILGLGGAIIGAGAIVPLGIVFATDVLGSSAQYGVMLLALGIGAALGLFGILAFQKRLPRPLVFQWALIGSGGFLIGAVSFNVAGITALLIAAFGACAASAYVTGFTMIQETVSDELRGRTFATIYAVIRLCLLLSLTISPLLSGLVDWIFSEINGSQHIQFGGFGYSFPGVRVSLWAGGWLTVASGLYARRQLARFSSGHPAMAGMAPDGSRPAPAHPDPAPPSNDEAAKPDPPEHAGEEAAS